MFLRKFPNEGSVKAFFHPARWGYCIQHKRECVTEPCVTLQRADDVYKSGGLAHCVVLAQFSGLYTMALGKAPYSDSILEAAVDLFISRNGSCCTLYQMMLYFGGYLSDYKSTMASWDIGDILRSYQTRFIPKLDTWMEAYRPGKGASAGNVPAGREALLAYLRREQETGTDIRRLHSVRLGLGNGTLTEEDLMAIEAQDGSF